MNELEVPPAPRPARTKHWLWLIVGTLVAAFATVAALQWRQFTLLNDSVRYDGDNIVWSFFQLETEYLKLRQTLRRIDADPATLDRDALQLRYDLFVSRVPLVDPERTAGAMAAQAIQTDTVARVRRFVAMADAQLGPEAVHPFDATHARALLAELDPLGEPVHDMATWANDAMAERVGARNGAVRQQNRISIALMAFQLLLTALFTLVVVRQFRTLEQRGSALENLAARLHTARHEAETASRTKSAFLANMSHELRTPFQGVLGMLALIEGGPLNPQQADQLRTARESATHLLSLLNDVLDVSTLEHGKLKLAPAPTDLRRLVADVEALMGGQARAKGLALRVQHDPAVPGHVLADATRLKQILFNLVGNAIKFTDSGSVQFAVNLATVADDSHDAPALIFTVTDTGVGMDAPTRDRLFQRFSQGDDSTSRRFGGTGLGLEISRNLARMMGGDIAVSSEPGRGSCFTLRVPLPACAAPASSATAPQTLETPSLRVLVAEDHPVNRKYLHALLTRLGHQPTLCENGQLALDRARAETHDVVLMDMHMPVLDGLAATRAIRALPPPHGLVPIVALTADAFADTRARAAEAGMNDFLAKPVQPVDLQAALARLFGTAPAAPAEPKPAMAAGEGDADCLDLAVPDTVFEGLPSDTHAMLLHAFFDDDSGSLSRLSAELATPDARSLREAAHAVRGVALNLGLRRLARTVGSIETRAHAGQVTDAAEQLRRLRDELAASRSACVAVGWLAPAETLA